MMCMIFPDFLFCPTNSLKDKNIQISVAKINESFSKEKKAKRLLVPASFFFLLLLVLPHIIVEWISVGFRLLAE